MVVLALSVIVGGLGALAAWVFVRGSRDRLGVVLGVGLVLVTLLLLAETATGEITILIGLVGGVGLGLAVSGLGAGAGSPSRGRTWLAGGAAGILALGMLAWVGANDPAVGWFGPMRSHGPRDGDKVAITFDDGPDPVWTLEVRDILDAHRVKATFFEVGRALEANPNVARALYDHGHLLGNHSYHHDYWRWLDPRYPELDRTQDAFRRHLGVCPALFRPPHGQRTPFMLYRVQNEGLYTVTWDVSAQDWSDDDGRRVAERILDQVRPGSIILLHDGLDGRDGADRSVLLTALPRILDGLAARGLHPVRLDELLDLPGYIPC